MSGLTTRTVGMLFSCEERWRDQYDSIYGRGYELRPRYHPKWEPSWIQSGKDFFAVEDGQPTILRSALDATRLRDGKQVMLKKVYPEEGPHELIICHLLSSREFARDPHNHCVPLLDILETQNGQKLMVFPFLRPFNNPRFQTFGEFVAFFTQICEGLQFLHERNIAHRDCTANNIMFDPSKMYPQGYHPTQIDRTRDFKGRARRYTRTQRPPRYYLIDFGLSRQYFSRNALDVPLRGGDKSAPEHRNATGRCNPFHTDIYYLGNLVRQEFIQKYNGFEFMQDLVDWMTLANPAKRPSIEDVVENFSRIRKALTRCKLRSYLASKHKPKLYTILHCTKHAILSSFHTLSQACRSLTVIRSTSTCGLPRLIITLSAPISL